MKPDKINYTIKNCINVMSGNGFTVRIGKKTALSLGIIFASIILIFGGMSSNNWMTGVDSDDEFGVSFGFSEYEWDEFEEEKGSISYSHLSDDVDEISDAQSAGTVALIFLWIAAFLGIVSLIFIFVNTYEIYSSNYGIISSISAGSVTILGLIIWFVMFPSSDIGDELDVVLSPGMSFYVTILVGLSFIGAGIIELGIVNVIGNSDDDMIELNLAKPTNKEFVSLGLATLSLILIFGAISTNSWSTDIEDDAYFNFGLFEIEVEEIGGTQGAEYSGESCSEDEWCSDIGKAGLTTYIFMLSAVLLAIATFSLISANSFDIYKSNYGMITAFATGALSILGAIMWAIFFPSDIPSFNPSFGFSFYLALIGGLTSFAVGVVELKFKDSKEIVV